jgi:hypothetical protein
MIDYSAHWKYWTRWTQKIDPFAPQNRMARAYFTFFFLRHLQSLLPHKNTKSQPQRKSFHLHQNHNNNRTTKNKSERVQSSSISLSSRNFQPVSFNKIPQSFGIDQSKRVNESITNKTRQLHLSPSSPPQTKSAMLPLLLLVGVPSAAGSCYVMRGQGQKLVVSANRLSASPTQSAMSISAGVGAFFGAYGVGAKGIRFLEDLAAVAGSTTTTTTTTPKKAFVAPQSVRDALQRAGKPLLFHTLAASAAFFAAGAVQTQVAAWTDNQRD